MDSNPIQTKRSTCVLQWWDPSRTISIQSVLLAEQVTANCSGAFTHHIDFLASIEGTAPKTHHPAPLVRLAGKSYEKWKLHPCTISSGAKVCEEMCFTEVEKCSLQLAVPWGHRRLWMYEVWHVFWQKNVFSKAPAGLWLGLAADVWIRCFVQLHHVRSNQCTAVMWSVSSITHKGQRKFKPFMNR